MPIPVLTFPYKNLEQLAPQVPIRAAGIAAQAAEADLLTKAIENQKAMIALKYAQPEMSERLNKMRLENRKREFESSPQMLEAQLAEAAMKAPKTQADIENILSNAFLHREMAKTTAPRAQSDIASSSAHANYYNEQAKNLPLEQALKERMFEWQKKKFENPNIAQLGRLMSSMPVEMRSQFLAENPEFEDMVKANIGRIAGGAPNNAENNLGLEKGLGAEQGNINQQSPDILNEGMNIQGVSERLAPMERKTLGRYNSVNNRNVDAKIKARASSAIANEKWMDENREKYGQRMANAAIYSGIKGKSQKIADAITKNHPEMYQDYLWLKNNFNTFAGNQVRMTEGMAANKYTSEELSNIYNTIDWDRNPEQAVELMNRAYQDIKSITNGVFNAAEPIHQGVKRKLHGLPEYNPNEVLITKEMLDSAMSKAAGNNNQKNIKSARPKDAFSDKNIADVAKKYGMTADQMKDYLKKEGAI